MILFSLSLQRLNFLFEHCTYVHGLLMSFVCYYYCHRLVIDSSIAFLKNENSQINYIMIVCLF